jgi:hypothetical protein
VSRLLRGRVRRLEERAAVGNVGRMIVETLEAARARLRRGEPPPAPGPQPSREELEREVAAGGDRRLLAAARLRAGLHRQEATP